MAITNGYGEQNKIRLLAQYRLHPVMHTVLLPGQTVTCCCGQPITDEFYQFDAIDYAGNVLNVLFASVICAQALWHLSQTHSSEPIVLLPLFNPLQLPHGVARGESDAHERSAPRHPLNAEVEEAIYLTMLCGDAFLHQPRFFTQLLNRIRRNPLVPIMDWEVKAMNGTISKNGRCLTSMLNAHREKSAGLKHYTFPEISAALKREAARTGLRIHCNL